MHMGSALRLGDIERDSEGEERKLTLPEIPESPYSRSTLAGAYSCSASELERDL